MTVHLDRPVDREKVMRTLLDIWGRQHGCKVTATVVPPEEGGVPACRPHT